VALRGEQPVGALVAAIDRRAPCGTFGFFDCVNDEATAVSLFDAGLGWLHGKGVTHVEGPIQVHALGGYRLQIAGHERTPFIGEPRNPIWYPALVERLGFCSCATWRTWDFEGLKLLAFRAYHRVQGWKNARLRRRGFKTVEMNGARFEEEMTRIYPIIMECYAGAPAFWPLDLDEYLRLTLPLKSAGGVRGALLYKEGEAEPIGFGMGIEEPERGVMHSFGILRRHRGLGLAHLVMEHAFAELRKRPFKSVVGALAKEGTTKYDEVGGKPSRRYALYRRDTSPVGRST
jgi:ribosomal protein S18 acetylase RimI-like enzyme